MPVGDSEVSVKEIASLGNATFVFQGDAARDIGIIDRKGRGQKTDFGIRVRDSQEHVGILSPKLSDAKQTCLPQYAFPDNSGTGSDANGRINRQIISKTIALLEEFFVFGRTESDSLLALGGGMHEIIAVRPDEV